MLTVHDEHNGLVKTTWQAVRHRVQVVEPRFAQLVDSLSPGDHFPLYLAYYPYGALKGDTLSTFLPKSNGGFYRLSSKDAPHDVQADLGYGSESAPLALLLEKNLELFVDLPDVNITIPRALYQPGMFFPFARILSRCNQRIYAPNGVLTLTSGARSAIMLPNIGCATQHVNLQRDFNMQIPAPKSLYEHWGVFKAIAQASQTNWRACVMYFSQIWLDKMDQDPAWMSLKLYLHELAWRHYEYQRNQFYYDVAFSTIQQKRNLKPNPYLVDTAKHLYATVMGAAPGYVPAEDEQALPLKQIQQAFLESYGLSKYAATILQPKHFSFEHDQHAIYYSLQHPATHVFSPKSRRLSSTLADLRELAHLVTVFTQELQKKTSLCSDTILHDVAKQTKFDFFHNKYDAHRVVQASARIPGLDHRFVSQDAAFASDAPFVRGCIRMAVTRGE